MSDFDDDNDSDLVKQLRKQLADAQKANKEISEQFSAVAKRDRERTLKDVFAEKGVKPSVAKFFPADAEVTEESVSQWLTENAEVFGIQTAPQEQPPGQATPQVPGVPDAYSRLANLTQTSAANGGDAEVLHAINNATTEAELTALIFGAGGGGL